MLTKTSVQVGRTEEYLSLLPVEVAASVLEDFYNVVIDSVRQEWIQQQPANSFTITWQNIELEFYSATRTIPVRQHLKWFLPVRCSDPSRETCHGIRTFTSSIRWSFVIISWLEIILVFMVGRLTQNVLVEFCVGIRTAVRSLWS